MKKILIADDDPDIVKLLSSRFKANGYDVVEAQNGVWVVVKALKENPDLIVLDINMPAGNGVSVFEQLKKHIQTLFTPVIFITGYPSYEVRNQVVEMGADGFISKPFDAEELLFKVEEALGEVVV